MSKKTDKMFAELQEKYNKAMDELMSIKEEMTKYCPHNDIQHYSDYTDELGSYSPYGNEVYSCSDCRLQGNMVVEAGQNGEKIVTKSDNFDMLEGLYNKKK